MSESLRAKLDGKISDLQNDLIRMGERVDHAIQLSLKSLQDRDQQLAQSVIDQDEQINQLRYKIEEQCVALIVTQQPAATDLRTVISIMNIVVDVERMGDHAAGIAKTVIRMGDAPLLKPLIDIPRMAELGRDMLRQSLQALIKMDVDLAKSIAAKDDEMDMLYMEIFSELVDIMSKVKDSATRATYLLWCAHNLERIGDRVTNIAERVVFVSTGDLKELNPKSSEFL